MASQRLAGQRFRQRKLSVKQNLSILKESEIEQVFDDEAQRNIPKVETGVEKAEEIEHHLQKVINSQAVGDGKDAYIPTPPTNLSGVQYERLYSPQYHHPQTYIRFSSTVEDSIGCPYSMNKEDEIFLINLNSSVKKSPSKRATTCSEDQFEEIMNFFEQTTMSKQPFASVDNAPVLTYAEMEAAFDETLDDFARRFAKDIYEHWKTRRLGLQNHPLMPALKFERNVDTDDSDPYVCFRRREVRQARKTRGRDAQIAERLKRLRIELEQARQLLHLTKEREHGRKQQITLDGLIFERRAAVKEAKRNLGIKGDDQDLINQKPVEKVPKPESAVARIPGTVQKVPGALRPDGRHADHDLRLWSDEKQKRENEANAAIQEGMNRHIIWNQGWVDNTWRPITPPLESGFKPSFRAAVTEYLPTPPSSTTTEEATAGSEAFALESQSKPEEEYTLPFRYASPPTETAIRGTSFRRRVGRGGRLWIDRRCLKRKRSDWSDGENVDESMLDRMEYDVDSDEDPPVVEVNPYDTSILRYRVVFGMPSAQQQQQQQQQQQHQHHQKMLMEEAQRRGITLSIAAQGAVKGVNGATTNGVYANGIHPHNVAAMPKNTIQAQLQAAAMIRKNAAG